MKEIICLFFDLELSSQFAGRYTFTNLVFEELLKAVEFGKIKICEFDSPLFNFLPWFSVYLSCKMAQFERVNDELVPNMRNSTLAPYGLTPLI